MAVVVAVLAFFIGQNARKDAFVSGFLGGSSGEINATAQLVAFGIAVMCLLASLGTWLSIRPSKDDHGGQIFSHRNDVVEVEPRFAIPSMRQLGGRNRVTLIGIALLVLALLGYALLRSCSTNVKPPIPSAAVAAYATNYLEKHFPSGAVLVGRLQVDTDTHTIFFYTDIPRNNWSEGEQVCEIGRSWIKNDPIATVAGIWQIIVETSDGQVLASGDGLGRCNRPESF